MHIKTIVAGAALALAATIGSASAAEQFSTLKGLPAVAMAPTELAATRGAGTATLTTPGGTNTIPHNGAHAVFTVLVLNPTGKVTSALD